MNLVVTRLIEYLNSVTGSNIPADDIVAISLISHQLEAHTEEEIKSVIRFKTEKWKGTKYAPYLRPKTLFGDKFKNYLNESRTTKTRFGKIADSVERAKSAYWKLD